MSEAPLKNGETPEISAPLNSATNPLGTPLQRAVWEFCRDFRSHIAKIPGVRECILPVAAHEWKMYIGIEPDADADRIRSILDAWLQVCLIDPTKTMIPDLQNIVATVQFDLYDADTYASERLKQSAEITEDLRSRGLLAEQWVSEAGERVRLYDTPKAEQCEEAENGDDEAA